MKIHSRWSPAGRAARALAVALVAVSVPAWAAEIRGRVVGEGGDPVDHARVADRATGRHVFTGAAGDFKLDCAIPCLLAVSHPWLDGREVRVERADDVLITLTGGIEEQVVVTGVGGLGEPNAPTSLSSTSVRFDERLDAPGSVLEYVEQVPGVAENGQGGLFQVWSIRGVSRQRVATLVAGMPVVGERRAGASASFIDPLLLEGAEVLRGPSSTSYGSGALGGVVELFPRRSEGWRAQAGFDSFGDEHYLAADWGNEIWSVGIARRSRDDDEAADGSATHTGFTQTSATVSRRWRRGDLQFEALGIASLGRDIAKASSDFPDTRVTDYPEENHLMARLAVVSDHDWRIHLFVHPNDLRTETLRIADSFSVVENDAVDFGAGFRRDVGGAAGWRGRLGLDYFGRRGVVASENGVDLSTGAPFSARTLDGDQGDAALYATFDWNWGRAKMEGGGRFVWHRQAAAGNADRSDTGWTGFVGMTRPLIEGFDLVANVGAGLRFPSLSERFFSGTTGRGQVIGNPGLDAENSIQADLGLRYSRQPVLVNLQLFRMEVDDYIERVDLAPDLQSFVNLTSGTLQGVELDGQWHASDRWQLYWSAARIRGEEEGSGRPLPDVPSHRGRAGVRFRGARWGGSVDFEHRAAKSRIGSGEQAISGADLLSLAFEWQLRPELGLRLRGGNLLDQVYLNSADSRSPVAAGRSVGLGLIWSR